MTYQVRLLWALAIVFALYAASNFVMAALVPALYGFDCSVHFLSTQCAFEADSVRPFWSYAILGALIVSAMIGLRIFGRDAVTYPFLMLFGGLALGAIAFDLALGKPVINGPKITNDTINILGSVIAASFLLLLVILRRETYSLASVARAATASYAIKVASVSFFIAVCEGVFGATELFLLYIVYAFGAFSLHLMTVCGFVARTASAKPEIAE